MPGYTFRQLHSKLGISSLLQRPRSITPADGPGMKSNFSNGYNFLMPLSVSVFNQGLMILLRKSWQISSIKKHSTFLTNSILCNISCRLSSQYLTQLQLQRAPGILDSPKPLKTPVPLGKVTWIFLEAMDCYHKLSCLLHLLEFIYLDAFLSKELLIFTSATHLPLPHLFSFLSQKPHCNHLGLLQDLLQFTPAELSSLSVWCRHDAP